MKAFFLHLLESLEGLLFFNIVRALPKSAWRLAIAIFAILPFCATAQIANTSGTNSAVGISSNYAVVAIGGNYQVWQKDVPTSTNQSGQVAYGVSSYTELATGMNYLANGQWMPSTENIQITATGGAATNGQHQVTFAADINTSNAVGIVTPGGQELKTHIMGLSYYDTSTGSNVLFAELQDSIGQVVNTNQVVYTNAFAGCDSDVLYTYRKSGVEQDIVVQQQLPPPESYGLTPANTWLEVWTEFTGSPTPSIQQVSGGNDEFLDFGSTKMLEGRAFIMGNESNSVPVYKQWLTVQGRTFLVERVNFNSVASSLQQLPSSSGGGNAANQMSPTRYKGFPHQLPPQPKMAIRSNESLKLAQGSPPAETGLVLDYTTLNSAATNYTFHGDTTYYINGNVVLSGITTFEGGTVIKFATNGSGEITFGTNIFDTAMYQPAMFTSAYDDSLGQTISGSTGIPATVPSTYLDCTLSTGTLIFSGLRVSYASTGIYNNCFSDHIQLWDCQFVSCGAALNYLSGLELDMFNVLVSDCGSLVNGGEVEITGANVTIDNCTNFITDDSAYYGGFTNSIFTDVTGASALYVNFDHCYTNSSASGVYQTVGAGNYYLVAGSPYRDAGNSNIEPGLLADLAEKTTYPPITNASFNTDYIYLGSANTTLNPQAPRDYDTPDLGYHYDPIDYMTTCDYSNCTLTLTNGVVIGYWRNFAISLDNYGQLVSQGTANQRNVITYYSLVQEQSIKLMSGDPTLSDYPLNAYPIATWHPNTSQNPSISLRLTSIYAPQVSANILYTSGNYAISSFTARDTETCGAGAGWYLYHQTGPVNLINNLFQYTQVNADATGSFNVYNTLYRGGGTYEFQDYNSGGATISNRDNAFDATVANMAGTIGYNAYLNGATDDNTHQTGDIFTNLTWVAGPLGYFYQATNSLLLNATNTTADQLGLYHYTVTTNEVKETNSWVDIGYHYVAVGTNGLPFDSNGDGIPDYLEDANGNGTVDNGEISWFTVGDLGLQVLITKPQNNSTLP